MENGITPQDAFCVLVSWAEHCRDTRIKEENPMNLRSFIEEIVLPEDIWDEVEVACNRVSKMRTGVSPEIWVQAAMLKSEETGNKDLAEIMYHTRSLGDLPEDGNLNEASIAIELKVMIAWADTCGLCRQKGEKHPSLYEFVRECQPKWSEESVRTFVRSCEEYVMDTNGCRPEDILEKVFKDEEEHPEEYVTYLN